MKAASFVYHRAGSTAEAVTLLDDYQGSARILAGGQSLLPMLNMRLWRPGALIDINGIDELTRVRVEGPTTVLGALVRYSTIEHDPVIAERLPLLARVVRHIGDRQVRNRGTLGGSLVQADPTGEMPLVCLLLGATVRAMGPRGSREIPVAQLYAGSYATVLDPDELVTEIAFPAAPAHVAFAERCRRHNDFAVLSVAATGDRGPGGRWSGLRIGLGGVADTAVLAPAAAAALDGTGLADDAIEQAARLALDVIDPPTDVRASAEYRRHLVPVYVRRVLAELRRSGPGASGTSTSNGRTS
ncbi:FAD binding domain-containing protein [Pseudonocardia sp. H11422]|uniref:FAD binding domain-containing protein n=1 Tax=Pseudonocardia sp. H11422 TaxID=2835866 RepID=UPI001BDC286D|nr:xanthine dehydrogenase family protein subunit M [Pseudonocardia sp. H11422]